IRVVHLSRAPIFDDKNILASWLSSVETGDINKVDVAGPNEQFERHQNDAPDGTLLNGATKELFHTLYARVTVDQAPHLVPRAQTFAPQVGLQFAASCGL